MKRIAAFVLFATSSLSTVGTLAAQEHQLRAAIPFEFTLNGKLLPAGTYKVSSQSPQSVTLRNDKKHVSVSSITYASGRESSEPVLIFRRYGERYFLSEILDRTTAAMNVEIPRSKQEKKAQMQEEAALRQGSQTLVALK